MQAYIAPIVDPQRNGLVASQRKHIEGRQGLASQQANRPHQQSRKEQLQGLGPVERGLAEALQDRELARADLELDKLGKGADQQGQY